MIVVLDFGSQYTQLIARRLRELGVYAEILPCHAPARDVLAKNPAGLILSGGPSSVHEAGTPRLPRELWASGLPLLGICYGMQLLVHAQGGAVAPAREREYGHADLRVLAASPLFAGLPASLRVWMSHGDAVRRLGNGFRVIARTKSAPFAAVADPGKRWYGVQFHPEVVHTAGGGRILENFARRVCRVRERWTLAGLLDETLSRLREQVGSGKVLCALSGGVDSSVAAALLHRAVGGRLFCVYVDSGLGRLGDRERIGRFRDSLARAAGSAREGRANALNLRVVDASRLFLRRLKGVADPERKRKIIGHAFIEIFRTQALRLGRVEFLAQGTLYPDVIESVSVHGPSATIKTHHNVGGLPKRMRLKLIEPLRALFKDEVRGLGKEMGLPETLLGAHPFPGPGLAVRILGPVTPERLGLLRRADAIVQEELQKSGWYDKVWQAFPVLLPVKSVGVMGDARTHERVIALRAVHSVDGMTADWARLPPDLLAGLSRRITSEIRGVNRVVYDISSKPPSTIEWE